MKHFFYLPILSSLIFFSSCNKERRNCKCTDNNGQSNVYTMEKGTKTQNKQECKSYELPGQVSCELEP